MSVRIICLGNELVSDDGIGVRVGRVLAMLDLPEDVRLEFHHGIDLDLLETLREGEDLLVVDAMETGRPPGTVALLEVEQVAELAATPFCCHGVGIAELLALARRMFPERLPERAAVLGIEGVVFDQFSTKLSPEVAEALPEAVEQTLRFAGVEKPLRDQGAVVAQNLKDEVPHPADNPATQQKHQHNNS